jgi:hypothetical protein
VLKLLSSIKSEANALRWAISSDSKMHRALPVLDRLLVSGDFAAEEVAAKLGAQKPIFGHADIEAPAPPAFSDLHQQNISLSTLSSCAHPGPAFIRMNCALQLCLRLVVCYDGVLDSERSAHLVPAALGVGRS